MVDIETENIDPEISVKTKIITWTKDKEVNEQLAKDISEINITEMFQLIYK